MTFPFPIGDAPGQWNDPPDHVIDADDLHERIDVPLDALWNLSRRAAGVGATIASTADTVVSSGGSGTTQIPLTPTARGVSGEVYPVSGGGVVLPTRPALYLVNFLITSTNIAQGFAGRTFADVTGGAQGSQRQPFASGTEDGGGGMTVPLIVVDGASAAVRTVKIYFYHSSGANRTVRLAGSITRLVDL